MVKKHIIIYIPGLGDSRVKGQRLALRTWTRFGVRTHLHQMNWADGEAFEPKLKRLVSEIDIYKKQGLTVSLIAASAGASAAVNAYVQRKDDLNGVIFVCGKLSGYFHPSYHQTNPAFAQSMEMLPTSLAWLNDVDTAKMLSLHPIVDPTVPVAQTRIPGVRNHRMPVSGHAIGIGYGITVRAKANVRFFKQLAHRAS
jgi:hypothetical protein